MAQDEIPAVTLRLKDTGKETKFELKKGSLNIKDVAAHFGLKPESVTLNGFCFRFNQEGYTERRFTPGTCFEVEEGKTVDVVQVLFKGGEERQMVTTVKLKDQKNLQTLRDAKSTGLVREPDEKEKEEQPRTYLIRDISELENGKLYYVFYDGIQNSISSVRTEQTHLTQRRENEASQALLREMQRRDSSCHLDSSLRRLTDSEGQEEMEVDGVINCERVAYVLSHKTHYDRASKVAEIAEKARQIKLKSSLAEYAGTPYGKFKGQEVVPAFMADSADSEDNLLRAADRHKVLLIRRNGSSISPWASLTPLKRAAARPAMRRWVV